MAGSDWASDLYCNGRVKAARLHLGAHRLHSGDLTEQGAARQDLRGPSCSHYAGPGIPEEANAGSRTQDLQAQRGGLTENSFTESTYELYNVPISSVQFSVCVPSAARSWPTLSHPMDFPGSSVVKSLPAHAGDTGLIPGLGRFPGGGNGNPLQYSCLENLMDRGAWRAPVHGVAKSRTQLAEIKPPSLASPGTSRPILYQCATWETRTIQWFLVQSESGTSTTSGLRTPHHLRQKPHTQHFTP